MSASAVRPLSWFARHEARLTWRDIQAMMTAGRKGRERAAAIWLTAFVIGLHIIAYLVVRNFAGTGLKPDLPTLIGTTVSILLSGSAMLSQAMENVTRIFYSRSDLELILSAPVRADRVFAVRIAAMAISSGLMSALVVGPFIDVLIWREGPRWFGAYGVLIAVSLVTTALAVVLTMWLFQLIGPRRTRLAAQIAAAIVGGLFVIGLQSAAMFSSGTLSRMSLLRSAFVLTHAPGPGSLFWAPARAALGNGGDLVLTLGVCLVIFLVITAGAAPRFASYVAAASSVSHAPRRASADAQRFTVRAPQAALRRKERLLILRDPWLISQSLMQLLYLSPPAILLWHNWGRSGMAIILVPVLVMASGQLAGGLAWLTISGEDAPDLVGSAPLNPSRLLRAKAEAVLQCIVVVFCLFVAALALSSPAQAAIAALGILISAASSIAIQLWFRSQAKRSDFRRRHTSSRIATIAEALISITWAAAGGIAVSGSRLWVFVAGFALVLLWCVWRFSPARAASS
jgi:ABC-2 type transport system permease protein